MSVVLTGMAQAAEDGATPGSESGGRATSVFTSARGVGESETLSLSSIPPKCQPKRLVSVRGVNHLLHLIALAFQTCLVVTSL